ncbi:MAG: hypothetical protein R6X14_03330 [bacterium]
MAPLITAVCSEIGRGHPQYLDSVLEALRRQGITDIPRVVPRWLLPRVAYRLGARGGPLSALYARARSGTPSRALLGMLDEGLRCRFQDHPGTVLVDHPLLAHLLGPVCRVGYVHGEIAAPGATAVPEAWRTFVPLPETASRLAEAGVPRERLLTTGLLIEPEIADIAGLALSARLPRLARNVPLSIAFFSSGAYPRPHLRLIAAALRSCLEAGYRATLFCGPEPRLMRRLAPGTRPGLRLVSEPTRRAENARTAELFPELDLAVAPAHERVNWAVGLGLPLFILEPDIGPFAPLNRAHALQAGVARPLGGIAGAHGFGPALSRLRAEGRLATMAEAGWGRIPVNGADAIASSLLAG